MAIGAKHVLVVALVTLLLTYAAYQGKSSSQGDSVSLAGRKGLPDPQSSETTAVLAEDSITETESDSSETTPALAEDSVTETESLTSEDATVQTTEGETSEETSDEATEETSEESTEETSEESTEETSEESTEQTSTSEQAMEDFKEEASESGSEEVSLEVSDGPVVEETEPTTTDMTTTGEESWSSEGNAEDVQTEENVDFSAETQESSEEAPFEGKQAREMEEAMAPQGMYAASGPSTIIENPNSSNFPEPIDNPNVYLQAIAQDNTLAKQNEKYIQSCIREDGCGTP